MDPTKHLVDNYLNGNITLRETRQSYIEVIIGMHAWFFDVYMKVTSVPNDTKTRIKDLSVRNNITVYGIVAWPASTKMIADLGEELVFTALFDGRYRDALRGHLGTLALYEEMVYDFYIKQWCLLDNMGPKLEQKGRCQPRIIRAPKVVKYGSDFTGLNAVATALARMEVPFTKVFSSDSAPECRRATLITTHQILVP